MSKTSFILLLLNLISWSCTEQQREGWEKRAEKLSGEEEGAVHAETLDPDKFALDQDRDDLIGIETTIVRRQTIDEMIELPAELVSNPNKVVAVHSPIEGQITVLSAELGSAVSRDTVIAVIENPHNLGQRFEVRAPLSGIVTERSVNVGEWMEAGKELMDIVDYSSVHAVIRIYPDEQAKIKAGQAVEIESAGIVAKGRITIVSPAVDPTTRTVEARAEISNAHNQLKANAYATARIFVGKREALVVPQSSVLHEEAHFVAFVHTGEGYEKRMIEVGIRHNDTAEILSGLQEGEAVVSEGAYQLKNINFTTTGGEEEEEE